MYRVVTLNTKLTVRIAVFFVVCCCFFVRTHAQQIIPEQAPTAPELSASEVPKASSDMINFKGAERFENGEELIMSLEVDNWRLADIVAIKTENGMQVSFSELLQALDFPIKQNSISSYSGWFINENNRFTMSSVASSNDLEVMVNGQPFRLSSANYQILYSDLFVELAAVSRWFELNPSVNFSVQTIVIAPKNQLPIQSNALRKKRRFTKFDSTSEAVMPYLNREHTIYSPQAVDFQANINKTQERKTGSYTMLGVREVLSHNTNFFVSGNSAVPVDVARLNVSKKSVNGNLLGVLDAKSYQFGDVTPVRVGNLSTNRLSRGLAVSNVDLTRSVNNEVSNFAGAILPGWDVELYRNDILLDQKLDVTQGRYEFNDIALLYGINNFELVFYGPQGQIVRETQTKVLSQESIDIGRFNYSMSLNQINQPLFKDTSIPQGEGQLSGYNLSGEYSFGFSQYSRIKLGHENIFGSGENSNLISLGVNTSLFDNSLLNYTVALNDLDERSLDVNFRTALGSQALSVRANSQTRLNREDKQLYSTHNIGLELNGSVFRTKFVNLAHQTRIDYLASPDVDQLMLNNSISASFGRTYLFNGLNYLYQTDDTPSALFGSLGIQHNFGDVFSRFQLGYGDIGEKLEFTNIDSDLTWLVSPTINARLTHSRSLIDDNHRSTVDINWRSDWWSLSTRFSHSNSFGWQAGLNARMSFSGTPEYDQFLNSNRGLTNRGSLLVRVFVDDNGDYIYNEGETLLPEIEVKSVQSRASGATNSNGVAELIGLIPNTATDIVIQDSSLEDPYLVPALPGVSIIPREGNIDLIDFPLVNASEIDGVLSFSNASDQQRPAAYVNIGLFDSKNQLVASALTEFDGFYLFTKIKPGRYTVQILPQSLKKFRVSKQLALSAEFDAAGAVLVGQDAIIEQYPEITYYLAHHGRFPSKRALDVYWQLNGQKLRDRFSFSNATFDRSANNGEFRLILLKSAQSDIARKFCNRMLQESVECTVTPITENLYPTPETTFKSTSS